jgi:cytochrome P450
MMRETAASSADVDISDAGLFANGVPHEVFATLRERRPVYWNATPSGTGFWVVTRYDDIVAVYRDPERYTSARGSILRANLESPDPAGGRMLVMTDPPRHLELRRALAGGFRPRTLERLGQQMVTSTSELLAWALECESVDFAEQIASRLPVAMTCALMGVPRTDWELMAQLTAAAFGPAASAPIDPNTTYSAARAAHVEILAYYTELVHERRRHPQDDLITLLGNMSIDGTPLSVEEIILHCDNLIVGGHETSRHAASGGLVALIERPASWAWLADNPAGIDVAVEEILRWTCPGQHVLRTATVESELHGGRIRAGDAVTLWNSSGNRDARAFSRPEEFDVQRTPNRHLTFGVGEHTCIGAALARLELRALFQALMAKVKTAELVGRPEYVPSNLVAGISKLPVRLVARDG